MKVDEKSGALLSVSQLGEQNEQTPKGASQEDAKQLMLRLSKATCQSLPTNM
ncbi:hypothetical protein [Brevibacillus reuszeri]|uniref:hypothetical protein n=1 Tax=Brevibacillus reuszeri TaxID=54915 RepID=UPI003D208503